MLNTEIPPLAETAPFNTVCLIVAKYGNFEHDIVGGRSACQSISETADSEVGTFTPPISTVYRE